MIGFTDKLLHSEHLSFRLLEERDKQALFEILKVPETTRPAGFPAIETEAAFEEFYCTLTEYRTAIAILLEGECIGYYHVNPYRPDLKPYDEQTNVGIGFLIGKNHLRKGYATETLVTLNSYLLGLYENIWGDYFIENTASGKTLIKCGFKEVDKYDMPFEELGEIKHIISCVLSRSKEEYI